VTTTSNRVVLVALRELLTSVAPTEDLVIYTVSDYVIGTFEGFEGRPGKQHAKNAALIDEISSALQHRDVLICRPSGRTGQGLLRQVEGLARRA
jgi:hypothetical protein